MYHSDQQTDIMFLANWTLKKKLVNELPDESANHYIKRRNSRTAIWHTPPFSLHPWKWFEGYPVKSALFFSRWQKHLRFSRVATWEKKWAIVVQKEKMPGCFFSFWIKIALKKNGCHALENLRCFWHLKKIG